jgi:hypothetical protein
MWIKREVYEAEKKKLFQQGVELGYEVAMKRQTLDKHNEDVVNCMRRKAEEGDEAKWSEIKRMLE